jgi:hypothetical protein
LSNVAGDPALDVAVWPTGSLFVQVTLSPTLIVRVGGANAEFWTVTVQLAASAIGGATAPIATITAATRSVRPSAIR